MDAENKRGMLKIKTKQKRDKFKFVWENIVAAMQEGLMYEARSS